MALGKFKDGDGVVKSVMAAYLILLLHVLLLVALGVLILVFRGLVNYMIWIFLGGAALIGLSGWWFYRRMKTEGRNLKEALKSEQFRNQTVEVSLLGGLASFRIGRSSDPPLLEAGNGASAPQLEDPHTVRVRELTELAKLLQSGLITREEYEKAKIQIFKG